MERMIGFVGDARVVTSRIVVGNQFNRPNGTAPAQIRLPLGDGSGIDEGGPIGNFQLNEMINMLPQAMLAQAGPRPELPARQETPPENIDPEEAFALRQKVEEHFFTKEQRTDIFLEQLAKDVKTFVENVAREAAREAFGKQREGERQDFTPRPPPEAPPSPPPAPKGEDDEEDGLGLDGVDGVE